MAGRLQCLFVWLCDRVNTTMLTVRTSWVPRAVPKSGAGLGRGSFEQQVPLSADALAQLPQPARRRSRPRSRGTSAPPSESAPTPTVWGCRTQKWHLRRTSTCSNGIKQISKWGMVGLAGVLTQRTAGPFTLLVLDMRGTRVSLCEGFARWRGPRHTICLLTSTFCRVRCRRGLWSVIACLHVKLSLAACASAAFSC
jgi:hypothetical protein